MNITSIKGRLILAAVGAAVVLCGCLAVREALRRRQVAVHEDKADQLHQAAQAAKTLAEERIQEDQRLQVQAAAHDQVAHDAGARTARAQEHLAKVEAAPAPEQAQEIAAQREVIQAQGQEIDALKVQVTDRDKRIVVLTGAYDDQRRRGDLLDQEALQLRSALAAAKSAPRWGAGVAMRSNGALGASLSYDWKLARAYVDVTRRALNGNSQWEATGSIQVRF